ncbi:MAG: hypothetical protein LM563_05275 [Thermofilum sp.]|nr:hypothetical protein [Thermofilum sp.]
MLPPPSFGGSGNLLQSATPRKPQCLNSGARFSPAASLIARTIDLVLSTFPTLFKAEKSLAMYASPPYLEEIFEST